MAGVYITEEKTNRKTVNVYRDDGTDTTYSVYTEERQSDYIPWEMSVSIAKASANAEEGLVSGWANVAINADGSRPLDWSDDVIQPATLEKAAIGFMEEYRESGVMHKGESKGAVVESIVFTKEKQAAIGIPEGHVPEGWFITVKIHDPEVFAKVKDGTYKMFSIQGTAQRSKL